ncbi:hypothetical protein BDR07DRAFT_1413845, partial [Suillus spraguei]
NLHISESGVTFICGRHGVWGLELGSTGCSPFEIRLPSMRRLKIEASSCRNKSTAVLHSYVSKFVSSPLYVRSYRDT